MAALIRGCLVAALGLGLLASCSSGSSSTSGGVVNTASTTSAGTATTTATAGPTAAPTVAPATPSASPTVAPATLAGCPATVPLASLTPSTRFGTGVDADDLVATAAGHVWVSAVNARLLIELDSAFHTLRTVSAPGGPEGIVVLADGTMLVAEQVGNRVDRFDPATATFTPFLTLVNHTGTDGVDGIALDSTRRRVLVPDSPNGTLLSVPLAGGAPTVLATGLGRPVAAWPEADGSVDVAMENAPGIVRIAPSGARTPIGHLSDLDEVLGLGGLLYVADLAGGTLRAVDPLTGQDRVLVDHSPQPQGLAFGPAGSLLLTDSTARTIAVVAPCH